MMIHHRIIRTDITGVITPVTHTRQAEQAIQGGCGRERMVVVILILILILITITMMVMILMAVIVIAVIKVVVVALKLNMVLMLILVLIMIMTRVERPVVMFTIMAAKTALFCKWLAAFQFRVL